MLSEYSLEYVARRVGRPWEARISSGDADLAEIRRGGYMSYLLSAKDGRSWTLEPRVHGELRPFSMLVSVSGEEGPVLTIREHLFRHRGKFYMLANSPAGRPLGEMLLGRRYISRLDGFPSDSLEGIDRETRSRLRRFRGVPVGEIDGLGTDGHRVRLGGELEDIALPLVACCYLLYSTA